MMWLIDRTVEMIFVHWWSEFVSFLSVYLNKIFCVLISFLELVYFKSLCFIFRAKMMLNKLRIKSMDEKPRKKRIKIKFWSPFQQARSCPSLHWLCVPEGRTVRTNVERHARPCVPPGQFWPFSYQARSCASPAWPCGCCSQFLLL